MRALVGFFLVVGLWAQVPRPGPVVGGSGGGASVPPSGLFAALPAASGNVRAFTVTNCLTSACTAGGGVLTVLLVSDGTTWSPSGSGGGNTDPATFFPSPATPPPPPVVSFNSGSGVACGYYITGVTGLGPSAVSTSVTGTCNLSAINNTITLPSTAGFFSYNVYTTTASIAGAAGNLRIGNNVAPGAVLVDTTYSADNVTPPADRTVGIESGGTIQTDYLLVGPLGTSGGVGGISSGFPLVEESLVSTANARIMHGINAEFSDLGSSQAFYGINMNLVDTQSGSPTNTELVGVGQYITAAGSTLDTEIGYLAIVNFNAGVSSSVQGGFLIPIINGGTVSGSVVGLDSELALNGGTITGFAAGALLGEGGQSAEASAVPNVYGAAILGAVSGSVSNIGFLIDSDGSLTGGAGISGAGALGLEITGTNLGNLIQGALEIDNGMSLSSSGTPLTSDLKNSGSITFGAINDGTTASGTFTQTGVALGDALAPVWPSALSVCIGGRMAVSAADTVTVILDNECGSTQTPGALTFGALTIH